MSYFVPKVKIITHNKIIVLCGLYVSAVNNYAGLVGVVIPSSKCYGCRKALS
jgi:hypothetical protein